MRGEDLWAFSRCGVSHGSPPHARGRPLPRSGGRVQTRITPACAGKTSTAEKYTFFCTDHPRMRGEDEPAQDGQWYSAGSPPHARGRLLPGPLRAAARGITPACAGKTIQGGANLLSFKDHPRMRGEDAAESVTKWWRRGSPPHARGRHSMRTQGFPATGITPACAGKTCASVTGFPAR